MSQVEVIIDAVRHTCFSRHRTVVLKRKKAEQYLPIWVGQTQADIIESELVGSIRSEAPDLFLASINASDCQVEAVFIARLRDNVFDTMLSLSRQGKFYEVACPTAMGIALAARESLPIFVEKGIMEKAALTLP